MSGFLQYGLEMSLAIAFEYSVCSSRWFILWMNYSEDTVVLFDNYGPLSHVSRPHVLVSVLCRQPASDQHQQLLSCTTILRDSHSSHLLVLLEVANHAPVI